MPKIPKKIRALEDLTPDLRNLNRGTKRGADLIRRSLENYGAGRSIVADRNGVIIAGNHVFEEAVDLGMKIEVVQTSGDRLLVHQRNDLDMADAKARELSMADNRASEVGLKWDADALQQAIDDGVRASEFFFQDEIARVVKAAEAFAGEAAAAPSPEVPTERPERPTPPAIDPGAADGGSAYAITFENEDQRVRWRAFVRYLGERFPNEPSEAARLDAFLRELERERPAFAKTEA